jgi:hypothetical protein
LLTAFLHDPVDVDLLLGRKHTVERGQRRTISISEEARTCSTIDAMAWVSPSRSS